MIYFQTDCEGEDVFILLDDEGVDDLISRLQFIKRDRESIHMLLDAELSDAEVEPKGKLVSHVKIAHAGVFR